MSVFEKRIAFKPFEYPEVIAYKEAINHSYWLHSEWSFVSDIQDYNVRLNKVEQGTLKRALLAISQIEVAVKKFWANLGNRFPKAEFDQVGICFGESEIRHADAYSHLLELLGFNHEFDQILENPVIQGRVNYLQKYLANSKDQTNQDFLYTLILFTLFIENVSLFSQFLVIKSFNKYKNYLKDIDNVVQATQKEETIHALFGVWLVKKIKEENPQWFNEELIKKIEIACLSAMFAETNIVEWIFSDGDLEFLAKRTVDEYLNKRFNDSLRLIGMENMYMVDEDHIDKVKWFDDEIHAEVNTDFFHKKPVTYSKKQKPIRAEDLF